MSSKANKQKPKRQKKYNPGKPSQMTIRGVSAAQERFPDNDLTVRGSIETQIARSYRRKEREAQTTAIADEQDPNLEYLTPTPRPKPPKSKKKPESQSNLKRVGVGVLLFFVVAAVVVSGLSLTSL